MLCAALLALSTFFAAATSPAPLPYYRFSASVTEDTVSTAIKTLAELAKDNPPYIVFEMNSLGGSVWDGFELSKAIENSPVKVVCVVDGIVASMAFYILQSCPVRLITNRSVLLVHKPINSVLGGNEVAFRAMTVSLQKLGRAMVQHYANHMRLSAKEIEARIAHGDWIMDAEEALKAGAVDGVVTSVQQVGSTLPRSGTCAK